MAKFEPFVPIYELSPKDHVKDENELLKEEIKNLKKQNEELLKELQNLRFALTSYQKRFEEEKKHLIQNLEKFSAEKEQLKKESDYFKALYEEEKRKKEELEQFLSNLSRQLNLSIQELEEKFSKVAAEVLIKTVKAILQAEIIPKEEEVKSVFGQLLKEKILDNEILLKVNPEDIPTIEEILSMKNLKGFEIVPDKSLKRGEFEIETDKFFIERRYEQLVEEFVKEILREEIKKVSNRQDEQTGH